MANRQIMIDEGQSYLTNVVEKTPKGEGGFRFWAYRLVKQKLVESHSQYLYGACGWFSAEWLMHIIGFTAETVGI
jgi:hypothetical protein